MLVRTPPGWMVVHDTPQYSDLKFHPEGVGEASHPELGHVVRRLGRDADDPNTLEMLIT